MASNPNNTATTLNPGTGGDSMDESLITQSDGTTSAKRPRVVLGGDANTGGNDLVQPARVDARIGSAMPVLDPTNAYTVSLLERMCDLLESIDNSLHEVTSKTTRQAVVDVATTPIGKSFQPDKHS